MATLEVVCPDNVLPGDPISVQAEVAGKLMEFEVDIPDGVMPGDVFNVNLPVENDFVEEPEQMEEEPEQMPVGTGGGFASKSRIRACKASTILVSSW